MIVRRGTTVAHVWPIALILFLATPAAASPPLQRQYQAGQGVAYRMTGDNDGWHYTAEAQGTVTAGADGTFREDFAWSNLVSNGQAQALPATMAAWRQSLSLDPNHMPSPPDLSQVDPRLIGPVTDLMTFYVDLWLANKLGQLNKAGDHLYFPNPMTPSWADGGHVRLGEDAVDFDMTLKSVDASAGAAVLEIKHVPPPQPRIHLPAPWMQTAAGATPNWVEVRSEADGTFSAAVGQESFDVVITVSLRDGHILHAEMINPVKTVVRACTDAALTRCGDAKPHDILRKVAVDQIP
jgi:hypothetical protein